jgi:hypothetical protein
MYNVTNTLQLYLGNRAVAGRGHKWGHPEYGHFECYVRYMQHRNRLVIS